MFLAIAIIFSGQTRNAYTTITDPDGNELEAGLGDTLFLTESGSAEIICTPATDTCLFTATLTGAGAVALDLADDGSNESGQLEEIAVTGDTNSIITEPAADKMLIDFGNAVPAADALAANPADCAASNFAATIAANGDLTCAQVDFTDLSGSATDGQIPDTITIDLATTATSLAADPANCPATQFATGSDANGDLECDQPGHGSLAGLTDDGHPQYALLNGRSGGQTLIGGTGNGDDLTLTTTSGPGLGQYLFTGLDCSGNANGGALTISSTGAAACTDDDDSGAGGGGDITDVGDCSTGACLTADGTGSTIYLEGSTPNTSEQIIGTDDPAADRTFNFPDDELADDDMLMADGAGSLTYVTTPDCDDSGGNHLNYDQGTNALSCGTSSSVTDTSANTECAGSQTYLDGEGNCDTLDDLAGFETPTDDGVALGTGAAFSTAVIPDCDDSSGNHLNYDTGTNVFDCGTTSSVTDTDTNADTECAGDTAYYSGEGNCNDIDSVYANESGDTFTGTTTITGASTAFFLNLDCSGFLNGGTLTTTGAGQVGCQDDDSGAGSTGTVNKVEEDDSQVGGSDIVTLDFGAGFDVSESPDTEINLTIDVEEAGLPNNAVWVGGTTGSALIQFVGDCADSSGNHLNFTAATNAFSCGTSSSVSDTNAGTECAGDTTYYSGEGNCNDLDSIYANVTGDTFTGTTTITGASTSIFFNLDCSGFLNGGTLSATGSGQVHCQDDDSGAVSQDLFETVDAPQGSDPVADSAADTLQFIAQQGTIGITGDSAADSLEWFVYGGGIGPEHIRAVDSPSDGECATYNVTGDAVEWASCGTGEGGGDPDQDLFETIATPNGDDPVADSGTDTLTLTGASGTISVTGSASADSVDFGVTPGALTVEYLSSSDSPSNGECAAYDNNSIQWGACGDADQSLFETIDVPTGIDPVAGSTTDTLTIAINESGGATLALTGSDPDTITFGIEGEQDQHAAEHSAGGTDPLYIPKMLTFPQLLTLATDGSTGSEVTNMFVDVPYDYHVSRVDCRVGTAPTGDDIIVDINYNGSTIFSAQGNRPTISAGATSGSSGTPDTTLLAAGGAIDPDIDQVGSTEAGKDLTCTIVGVMELLAAIP